MQITQNSGHFFIDNKIDVAQLILELNRMPLIVQQPNWHSILQLYGVVHFEDNMQCISIDGGLDLMLIQRLGENFTAWKIHHYA